MGTASLLTENFLALLESLTEAHGPSRLEDEVRERLINEIRNGCERLYVDRIGNLAAVVEGRELT